MIWIHGGNFFDGASSIYPGDVLATKKDVVVVTINYRTNAFGFLSNSDSLAGNYGLWDQQLAIRWVKKNIKDYGGDKRSITLFGESAGAHSITCHMISDKTPKNLFKRAITQSGSIVSLRLLSISPLPSYLDIGSRTNCTVSPDPVACLKSLPMSSLVHASANLNFFPTLDNDFLSRSLLFELAIFISNNYSPVPSLYLQRLTNYDILSGWNSLEGMVFTEVLSAVNQQTTGNNLSNGVSEEVFKNALHLLTRGSFAEAGELIINMTVHFYMNNPRPMFSDGRSNDDRRVEAFVNVMGK